MNTKEMVRIALMAAIISILAPISIPIGQVPISLATLAIMLSGVLFGKKVGTFSTCLYIILGMIGLPVFASYSSGIGIVVGMTGGYIIGYIPLAYISGWASEYSRKFDSKKKIAIQLSGMILGTIILYTIGTVYFEYLMKLPLWTALMSCVIPFILGDLIKMVCVLLLAKRLENTKLVK